MIYVNFMGKYVNRSKWLFLWGDRPKKGFFLRFSTEKIRKSRFYRQKAAKIREK